VWGLVAGYAGSVIDETLLEAMEKMDKAVEHTQSQFSTVRTGRATPSLVERITVEYYGAQVPLQQIASISVPEARQLLIKPHDRSSLEAVEKAIRDSDLGVAPEQRRHLDPLSLPQLTEERRRSTSRWSSTWPRTAASRARSIRRDARKAMEHAEKDGEISADELERAEKELEKVTHDHVEHIDAALGRKEQELLEV
jgi:ribosome recycling factor